jgi:hypothetical protein
MSERPAGGGPVFNHTYEADRTTMLEQVDEILVTYEDSLPLTVRQIYYRLVAKYKDPEGKPYPKDTKFYNRVKSCLVMARRDISDEYPAGRIPFSAIRDDGVTHRPATGWEDPQAFWSGVSYRADHYWRDQQQGQAQFVEVWCEAAGMAPQLSTAVHEYGVPVYSGGGFDSLTAKHDAARRAFKRDVPTVVLHVGDYDDAGIGLFDALKGDVESYVRHYGGPDTEVVRLALTPDQVEEYGVVLNDKGTAQLEALEPGVLDGIVRDAVEELFDDDVLAELRDLEEVEGADIRKIADSLAAIDHTTYARKTLEARRVLELEAGPEEGS